MNPLKAKAMLQSHQSTPAKLILSGEHAVNYGCPAIACAVNRFTHTCIKPSNDAQWHFSSKTFQHTETHTLASLIHLCKITQQRYRAFCQGDLPINQVLDKPHHLCLYLVARFLEQFQLNPSMGASISIETTAPLGKGMGASAAIIISLLQALQQYYHVSHTSETSFSLALETENLQHGYSSGLDLAICIHQGIGRYQAKHFTPLFSNIRQWLVIDTGTPTCTTGDCVTQVRQQFAHSNIWHEFKKTTESFAKGLSENHPQTLKNAINENHQLLCQLGVVPTKVQRFIQAVNAQNISAKICGAGAVRGDCAGMVLCSDPQADITELCKIYGYTQHLLQIEHDH